jgi:1,4-alpha-glucan branching enzyme
MTSTPTALSVPTAELDLIVRGEHGHPHAVLGPHTHGGGVTVRALKPLARRVAVRYGSGEEVELTHEHEGIWVGVLPVADVPDYRLAVSYDGEPYEVDDPYRFLPTLGEMDLHLINEGRHEQLWDVLGAHVRHYAGGVSGTSFAVWAPSARGIRLKASFNNWDGREHPMRQLGTSGVWELFVPDVGNGSG